MENCTFPSFYQLKREKNWFLVSSIFWISCEKWVSFLLDIHFSAKKRHKYCRILSFDRNYFNLLFSKKILTYIRQHQLTWKIWFPIVNVSSSCFALYITPSTWPIGCLVITYVKIHENDEKKKLMTNGLLFLLSWYDVMRWKNQLLKFYNPFESFLTVAWCDIL